MSQVAIFSKSPWLPSIRREHHLAAMAVARGHCVTFIERPADVRSIAPRPDRFVRQLTGSATDRDGLTVVARSVAVPGHRSTTAMRADQALLQRVRQRLVPVDAAAVSYVPWEFVDGSHPGRRIFDCTDDWLALFPEGRGGLLRSCFDRITVEADEIIVVNPELASLFPGREPVVIPNGVDRSAIAIQPSPPPASRSMAFVGTLSPRFDVELVGQILHALPTWTLDIYGPSQYPGRGEQTSESIRALLSASKGRVRLHGAIDRSRVPGAIDAADVIIIPLVSEMATGQSSMKLFDVAARGRPAVVAPGVTTNGQARPPGTIEARTTDEWADAITASLGEEPRLASERLAWARENTWDDRWSPWWQVVSGTAGKA